MLALVAVRPNRMPVMASAAPIGMCKVKVRRKRTAIRATVERQPAAQEHNRDAQHRRLSASSREGRGEARGDVRAETRGDLRGPRHAANPTVVTTTARVQPGSRTRSGSRSEPGGRGQSHHAKSAQAAGAKGGERPLHRSRGGQGANGQKTQRFEPVRMD